MHQGPCFFMWPQLVLSLVIYILKQDAIICTWPKVKWQLANHALAAYIGRITYENKLHTKQYFNTKTWTILNH